MEDEDATRIMEQYYRFLVFVWAVGKGYSNVSVKLTDPSEEEGADSLMFDAQAKLKAPTEDPTSEEAFMCVLNSPLLLFKDSVLFSTESDNLIKNPTII
jgi:hypothetical protein